MKTILRKFKRREKRYGYPGREPKPGELHKSGMRVVAVEEYIPRKK